jgi:hypothetical protein
MSAPSKWASRHNPVIRKRQRVIQPLPVKSTFSRTLVARVAWLSNIPGIMRRRVRREHTFPKTFYGSFTGAITPSALFLGSFSAMLPPRRKARRVAQPLMGFSPLIPTPRTIWVKVGDAGDGWVKQEDAF